MHISHTIRPGELTSLAVRERRLRAGPSGRVTTSKDRDGSWSDSVVCSRTTNSVVLSASAVIPGLGIARGRLPGVPNMSAVPEMTSRAYEMGHHVAECLRCP